MSYSLAAKKLRLPLGFLLAGLYLWLAPQAVTPIKLVVGAAIGLVGLAVRAWASGHIVKNDRLATSGPYAHTRNPLYFGSFLLAAGFAVAAHWSLMLLVIAFWVAVYYPTMERERANIHGRFPDHYPEYQRNVPAFVPRAVPWKGGRYEATGWSAGLYMKHGEWKAALGYLGALAYLVVRLAMSARTVA